jgi:hypothetical protein
MREVMSMSARARIVVVPTRIGEPSNLLGPFDLVVDSKESPSLEPGRTELLEIVVAFVRHVANGVSHYDNTGFENSSNLKSYAAETLCDLQMEFPREAELLASLVIDCSRLPLASKAHPIAKLYLAILRTLPGVSFVE